MLMVERGPRRSFGGLRALKKLAACLFMTASESVLRGFNFNYALSRRPLLNLALKATRLLYVLGLWSFNCFTLAAAFVSSEMNYSKSLCWNEAALVLLPQAKRSDARWPCGRSSIFIVACMSRPQMRSACKRNIAPRLTRFQDLIL